MGRARRQPPGGLDRQRQGPLTIERLRTADKTGVTRPGHIPTPPRPRPDRARPALPQELAATFWTAVMWRWRFSATCRNRAEQVANRARQDGNPWTLFPAQFGPAYSREKSPDVEAAA